MSVARPARGLLGRGLASPRTTTSAISSHSFHTTIPCSRRDDKVKSFKGRFRNVAAHNLGLHDPKIMAKYQKEKVPEYTKEELEALSKKYSPEHMEALKAGEAAIDPADLLVQGRLRDDAYKPGYMEDYTVLDPRFDIKPDVVGKPQEQKWPSQSEWIDEYGMKLSKMVDKKTDAQLTRAMVRALKRVKESNGQEMIDLTEFELQAMEKNPELAEKYILDNEKDQKVDEKEDDMITRAQALQLDEAVDAEWKKELERLNALDTDVESEPTPLELIEDGPAGISRANSAEAPELGKVPGVEGLYKAAADPQDQGHDDSGKYQELKRLTGMTLQDILSLTRKVLVQRRVVNQTRLGKVHSYSVVAIAGNGDGRLGLGIAKSTEPRIASETAQMLAIRNMKPIRRYDNRTIYGNVKAKVSGTIVDMYTRPPGFGLRCPHRIFEMCRAVGIHDIHVRMPRSSNPMNSVKATYQALMNQIDPAAIAIGRGKKMVDARKVYYGGAVY